MKTITNQSIQIIQAAPKIKIFAISSNAMVLMAMLCFLLLLGQVSHASEQLITMPGTRTEKLTSALLQQARNLNILLPASYVEQKKTYPVVYLLDGGVDEDFIHTASLIQYLGQYQIIPEIIVVGIANVDRRYDMTTVSQNEQDQAAIPRQGGADQFAQFITNELIPHIEKNYRTNHQRILIGQSLAGFFATKMMFQHGQWFSHYLIVSPSLWWNDESMLSTIEGQKNWRLHQGASVYLTVGEEHPTMRATAAKLSALVRRYEFDALELEQEKLSVQPSRHYFEYLPDENHASALHISLYKALKWFFQAPISEH